RGVYVDAAGAHPLGDSVRPIALGRGGSTLLLGPPDVDGDRFVLVDAADARHDVIGLPRTKGPVVARAHDDGFWLLTAERDDTGPPAARQLWLIARAGGALPAATYAHGPYGRAVDRIAANGDVYAVSLDPPRVLLFPLDGGEPETLYERPGERGRLALA